MATTLQAVGVNWGEFSKSGILPQALYLFSCRLAWIRYGDDHARQVLLRATHTSNAALRSLAVTLLHQVAEERH